MASKPSLSHLEAETARLRRADLYRRLPPGMTASGPYLVTGGKRLINMCSNDYLGMPPTPMPTSQMQSSSRLVSGNDGAYGPLERILARRKGKSGSLVFPTGYMANMGAITALAGRGDTILSDELNHASIIDACRLSGAAVRVYRHNDAADLDAGIRAGRGKRFVVTEGVFSMDGDLARLAEITEVAQKRGAITILDDAHGDFVVGRDGRGTASRLNTVKRIDVYTGSLSKGLGSFGGYVSADNTVIDACVNGARAFIYTSALPGAIVGHALARIRSDREPYRQRLEKNVRVFTDGLREAGFETGPASPAPTHIIPIVVGQEKTALDFAAHLYSQGIFAQAIRYPTVARGRARVRLSITAWLAGEHLRQVLDALAVAGRKFGVS